MWLADVWSLVLLLGPWFNDIFLRLLMEWFWWVAVLWVEADGVSSLLAWCSVLGCFWGLLLSVFSSSQLAVC